MKLQPPDRKEIDPNGLFSDKQHEAFQIWYRTDHCNDENHWEDFYKSMGMDHMTANQFIDPLINIASSWQMILSKRVRCIMNNARVYTKSQALEFIARNEKARNFGTRNFGKKSLAELKAALNIPEDKEKLINWGITPDGEIRFSRSSKFSIRELEKIVDYAKKATGAN